LITSKVDPMVYFEYHRHFTHSLIFIPIGALIVSLVLHLFFKNKISFSRNYFYSILGYATHGLLDSCTSYGTQLFWPFSDYRVAWNNVSIIDPLFTVPLIIFSMLALWKKRNIWSQLGLIWGISYLCFGAVQNYRATKFGHEVALSKGHSPKRLVAKPSFGNLFLWRIIYEHEDYFYTDAVRFGFSNKVFSGDKVKKLDVIKDFPWIHKNSQHYIDIKKFSWFSNGYLAIHPSNPNVIGDIRYSIAPNSIYPLWGIEVSPNNDQEHIKSVNFRTKSMDQRTEFLKMLWD